jgi:hypothetical protein
MVTIGINQSYDISAVAGVLELEYEHCYEVIKMIKVPMGTISFGIN